MKTIGILGGIGPEASANLYQKMIGYTQNQYNAVQDSDYPPIILYSLSFSGFDEKGIVDEELVKSQLIAGVKKLESAGCELIIIACNTVHVFYEAMQEAVEIPVFNIVEESRKKVEKSGYKKVGLLCSESTNKLSLYQQEFEKHKVEIITTTSEEQKKINQVIEHVMGGRQNISDVFTLKNIIQRFIKDGAEAIVLGCTEIPLAINQSHTDVKLFDTIEIIVASAVDFSKS